MTRLLLSLALWAAAHAALAPAARAQCGPHESAVIDSPAPAQGARFGEALAHAGPLLFVGAPREAGRAPDAGAVHLLTERPPGSWIGLERLTASDGASGDLFGAAVDVCGACLAIGAPGDDASRGAVYIFGAASGTWLELAVLRAADGVAGDRFGAAVALDGEQLLVGAPGASAGAGAALLYGRDPLSGAWLEQARWSTPLAAPGAGFGASLDLEGPWALVGAPDYAAPDAPGTPTGAVFAFERNASGWSAGVLLAPGYAQAVDALGASVCLDRARALVGAPRRDLRPDTGQVWSDSGAVLLLARGAGGWVVERELLPQDPQSDELFGASFALSGSTALVGAPDSKEGGAVYVLHAGPTGAAWIQSARLTASDGGARYGHALVLGAGTGSATGIASAPAKDLPGLPAAGGAYALAGLDELPPFPYCTAGTSPAGCRALLSSQGWPSAGARSGFTVQARGADGAADGTFLYGLHGRAALTFGRASTLCIAPPLARTPLLVASGPAGTCQGTLALDLNAFWSSTPGAALRAGTVVQVQLWYRAGGSLGALSDALEMTLCPGP